MQIKISFPPNYGDIVKRFILPKCVVFTYGDTIYNPSNGFIDDFLFVHEQTHSLQQGDNPDLWWDRYFSDDSFRFSQELDAYKNQYLAYCKNNKDRNKRFRFLYSLSIDLSSEMYGNLTTRRQAMIMIGSILR